jgi:tRNA pseudouridine65 synthase
MEIEILYQDEHLVAINKPSGLLVHRTDLDRHETLFALQIIRDQLNKHVYPIHRIDKPTSGVLLFALNLETAQSLSELFSTKHIIKQYIAIVRGWFPESIEVDRGVRSEKDKPRREALTSFRSLIHSEIDYPVGPFNTARYSLIEAIPETGRRHQIRKHLNHISYPIIGDTWYGDRDHNRFFSNEFQINDLMLHAYTLNFIHPVTNVEITIRAPLSSNWLRVFEILGIRDEVLNKF